MRRSNLFAAVLALVALTITTVTTAVTLAETNRAQEAAGTAVEAYLPGITAAAVPADEPTSGTPPESHPKSAATATSSVSETPDSTSTGSESRAIAPEPITAAGESARIGFNNAYQTVTTADGATHFVWLDGFAVMHGATAGSATETVATAVTSSTSRKSLAAIEASSSTLFIAWGEQVGQGEEALFVSTSDDGGSSWSTPALLASGGHGSSLASDGANVVAVWHTGGEDDSEVHFSHWNEPSDAWSEPIAVDDSTAGALWASVAVAGDDVWVTWRDNRSGEFVVYVRRSTDGGRSWEAEQRITNQVSGDPSICTGGGTVWLAHHGRGRITVLRSTDGGLSFEPGQVIGEGWFPRISCDETGAMIVGWEQSTGPSAKIAESKAAAYVTGDTEGALSATIELSQTAGTTASVTARGDGTADAVWINVSDDGGGPLSGELWRAVVEM